MAPKLDPQIPPGFQSKPVLPQPGLVPSCPDTCGRQCWHPSWWGWMRCFATRRPWRGQRGALHCESSCVHMPELAREEEGQDGVNMQCGKGQSLGRENGISDLPGTSSNNCIFFFKERAWAAENRKGSDCLLCFYQTLCFPPESTGAVNLA